MPCARRGRIKQAHSVLVQREVSIDHVETKITDDLSALPFEVVEGLARP
jgi:hypothetical protein